jgi:DNA-binding SARP family transcriptional activator
MDERGQRGADKLGRARLRQLVIGRPGTRLCTIVAPAGFGKSTLAAELLRWHDGPGTQVTVSGSEVMSGDLSALHSRLRERPHDGTSVMAVIDDVHLLSGTRAERDLAALVAEVSDACVLVLAGRALPAIDLHRFRLDGSLVEIDANDLRFRSWEVEELFHRVYRVRFPPSEVATLAAVTDGWAAGLQLYRHATQRSTDAGRRQQLERLRQCRMETVRSYLASNVLGSLEPELRRFAIESSVLGRMTAQTCNRLLDRVDSARCLEQLVDLQLFTTIDDDGAYRYHDVFRSFLESQLAASLPGKELADRYRAAGALLEEVGAVAEAVRAFTVAGSDADSDRLLAALRVEGDAGAEARWFDVIPAGLLSDQRFRLARARVLTRAGSPVEALAEYAALANDPSAVTVRDVALHERDRLRRWLEPGPHRVDGSDWTSVIRSALSGGPTQMPATPERALSDVLHGVIALVDGEPLDAAHALELVDHTGLDRTTSILAAVTNALAWWMVDGLDPGDALAQARDEADRARLGWTTRLLRSLLLAFPLHGDPPVGELLAPIDDEARRCRDPWSPAIGRLAMLLGAAGGTLRPQDRDAVIAHGPQAHPMLMSLGADTLARWSAVAAVAAAGSVAAGRGEDLVALREVIGREVIDAAASRPDRLGALLGRAVASFTTPPDLDAGDAPALQRLLEAPDAGPSGERPAELRARLLGAFELTVDGVPLALDRLRPRARSVLRLLALHAGSPVHRDVIVETMWPEADPAAAAKRLHVAISAIRHELGPAGRALVRMGETYRLGGDRPISTDLTALDDAIAAFQRERATPGGAGAEPAARLVMSCYGGDLLTDEGSAGWVHEHRELRKRAYVMAVLHLARAAAQRCEWDSAASLSELGLRHDRYADDLWNLTIEALQRSNRVAELERARSSYSTVLSDLGVSR